MTTATKPYDIPIQRPTLGVEEEQAAVEAIRSGWVSQGPKVAQFEKEFAAYVGSKHSVAVSNCTVALHMALVAFDIGAGDEVIVPSQTFIATPNSVLYTGATPVFADIEPDYYMIDPADVERRITPRTKAIIPVDLCMPADLAAIYDIADRHGLLVIEDAAPSIGTAYKSNRVGNSQGPVCFSFHPRKVITTGEGGMITTNSDELSTKLRSLRQHCMSVNDLARHNADDVVFEDYTDVGFNYRMTDIQAAIGIVQLSKLDAIVDERRTLAARYDQMCEEMGWLVAPKVPKDRTHNYQSYIARVKPDAPVSRDGLMKSLWKLGIQTRRGIMNCHLEAPYVERYGQISLPESERALRETLILPLFVGMTDEEQNAVIAAIESLDQ